MSNPSWPGSLPSDQFLNTTDKRQNARVVSQPSVGPAKVRRRYTAVPRDITTRMVLDGTQRATFDTFFITTLKEGSLPFDWTDPVDGSSVTYRFRPGSEPPAFRVIKPGSTSARLWETSLELELMP